MHDQQPRRPRSLWQTYGAGRPVGVLVGAALTFAVLAAVVIFVLPRTSPGPTVPGCAEHLRQLGSILRSEVERTGSYPETGGAPLLISWYRSGLIPVGEERTLLCSLDQNVDSPRTPEDVRRWSETDLANADALSRLCSFAVRDFARYPVDVDDTEAWIMCDRQGPDGRTQHHANGLHVLFADGTVKFMRRGQLGFAAEERIIVGPDSPHPELQKIVFLPADESGAPSTTLPR